ncbi:diguanylate cyclase [Caldibacillus lycopersici]|uniref:Diguanylate cyclase n=1 Tax=Perspicuibacillus lycopersici TaxID=1325689 RepID=A0AAE3IV29_9BACI|nr:diguanylate cyclase [Perspicuibacillus lycopersici]MCU9614747.1 diguanylate cyclase [Perspicuibacillus lycopersici]
MLNNLYEYIHMPLVIFAYLVGFFKSYVASSLIIRKGTKNWLLVSSVIMGGGIWAMHFIAMLSYQISIFVHYDFTLVFLSFAVAVIFSYFSFFIWNKDSNHIIFSGLFMGIGISIMHYLGMEAMHNNIAIQYNMVLVLFSIIIGTFFSIVAFAAFRKYVSDGYDVIRWKLSGSLFLGIGTVLLHYIGMKAITNIDHLHNHGLSIQRLQISNIMLGVIIGGFLLIVLLVVLLTSLIDERYTKKLQESEKSYRYLVEFSPEPIIVYQDGIIVFANDIAEKMLGYHSGYLIGRSIFDLVLPEYHQILKNRIDQLYKYERVKQTEIKIYASENKILDMEISSALILYNKKQSVEVFLRDVTERNMLEADLKRNEELYRFLTENSTDIISYMKPDGMFEYMSPSCEMFFDYTYEEFIGNNILNFLHPEEMGTITHLLKEARTNIDFANIIHRFRKRDGTYIWLETNTRTVRNPKRNLEGVLSISRDVTDRIEKEKELNDTIKVLQYLSYTDELTGIPNRRYFSERLISEWKIAKRQKLSLSALMIDIDYFKQFNDFYGHLHGDDCLIQIANVLKDTVHKAGAFIARYGGEEFIVLLPNTEETEVVAIGEMLLTNVRQLNIPNVTAQGDTPYVTISVGCATLLPNDRLAPEDLIHRADQALYKAKENGRNQVVVST